MDTLRENVPDRAGCPAPGRIYLYLARHGETVWNTEARMQGRGNSDLTARGLADASQLARTLAGIPLLAAFSSPARRALETAQLALSGRPVPLFVDERIHEMALGRYEGLTVAEANALDPENMDAFFHHAERFVPCDGERFADVMERIACFLAELTTDPLAMMHSHPDALINGASKTDAPIDSAPKTDATGASAGPDRHILIISHNITVKAMLTIMRRLPLSRLRDGHHIPQATLIPVIFEPLTGEYRLLPAAERILQ